MLGFVEQLQRRAAIQFLVRLAQAAQHGRLVRTGGGIAPAGTSSTSVTLTTITA
jgi:hypothetical protein